MYTEDYVVSSMYFTHMSQQQMKMSDYFALGTLTIYLVNWLLYWLGYLN
jgi:hypothetical protein